jgi:hypothetical protein
MERELKDRKSVTPLEKEDLVKVVGGTGTPENPVDDPGCGCCEWCGYHLDPRVPR